MPGVLLVARVRRLCLNPVDSIRGFVFGYLGWSRSPSLSGFLCFHTSDSGNLPIIVCYPFTFLYHLYIYISYNRTGYCLVVYIWSLVWGPSRAVGPGVATVTRYLRGLCLNVRWKVLDIAINVVSEVIVYAWGATDHTEYCVVPAGVTLLLGLHNRTRS
jgi:hypothetical protein